MNMKNIKIGESYTYKELCGLMSVEFTKATNKKSRIS